MIATIVIGGILLMLAGLAIFYLVRKKKQGGCIGCDSSSCSGACSCCAENPPKAHKKRKAS